MFKKQLCRSMEVYVDNLLVKSKEPKQHVADQRDYFTEWAEAEALATITIQHHQVPVESYHIPVWYIPKHNFRKWVAIRFKSLPQLVESILSIPLQVIYKPMGNTKQPTKL